jgi:hypothetical protein
MWNGRCKKKQLLEFVTQCVTPLTPSHTRVHTLGASTRHFLSQRLQQVEVHTADSETRVERVLGEATFVVAHAETRQPKPDGQFSFSCCAWQFFTPFDWVNGHHK